MRRPKLGDKRTYYSILIEADRTDAAEEKRRASVEMGIAIARDMEGKKYNTVESNWRNTVNGYIQLVRTVQIVHAD